MASGQEYGHPRGTGGVEAATDPIYDLISILYHSLKGAQVYDRYISDARESGDNELAAFFEQVRAQEDHRAQRTRELLLARLEQGHIIRPAYEAESESDRELAAE